MLAGLATSVVLAAGTRGRGRPPLSHGPNPIAENTTPPPDGASPNPLLAVLDPSASLRRSAPLLGPFAGTGPASEPPRPEPNDPGSPTARHESQAEQACPDGMILVEGEYRPAVGHLCLKRIEGPIDRCAEYASPAIVGGSEQKKRFCIDRFEYPNLEGVRPVVMVSWQDAKGACEAEDKRLCTSSEWTLACEGAERLPYPYGYARDSTACNIDRSHPDVDEEALSSPRAIASEVARLDQRVPSGALPRCKTPYGVQDMTGNVDEWVVNERHFAPLPAGASERPFISALKGGYWGPVRNRCRATTTFHNEWFRYYQIGFRCCANGR